ncbi:AAA family ATPase [Methanoculleus sp. Afa-1]|uniref:AAA family ATPase n=1 Tax=Methanoculleus formosensis TaxID=2590886 RepID=A0A9E4ZKZ0_9EURY|nr:helix-turn-helix domain-containing protein [Methanoculleus sp. Afa-1]MCT8337474.1 AAA family ATPase [Methanoculleus sp. Afa-1]
MSLPVTQLLSMHEGKTLEFKRDLSSPRNILKTLVAFANTAGGRLFIGVEDGSKEIPGVANPLDEEERLCSLIADNIEPRLVPNVELIAVEDKTLLLAEVYPSGTRPHWIKKEGPADGVYVRLGSTNRKANKELIAELERSAAGTAFDELPLPELTGDALDLAAARALFTGQRELSEKELLTLKLLAPVQGRLVPTVGGVLLFGRDREGHFPDAWIQCGRFAGTTKNVIFDHTEIHEHLPIAVERVIEFIKKHAMRGADLSEIRRRDVWSVPMTIVREAVINAIVHADYSQIGAPLRVAIYDDRVEIENPGILLPGMTIEDVRQGVSKIRNRVIARVFRELGLIEQWGSGFRRILDEAEKQNLPEPVLEEIGMKVRFTVFLAENISPIKHEVVEETEEPVTEQVKRLLICLKERPSGTKDAMQCLGLSHRPTFLYDYLRPAIQARFVQMTQPDSPKSPTQKYRLTEKGRRCLERRG